MSNPDGICGSIIEYASGAQGLPYQIIWPRSIGGADADRLSPQWFDWHVEICGLHFGEKEGLSRQPFVQTRIRVFVVPHLFIVVPLTALSMYLLLSKPRTKPKNAIEPDQA